MRKVWMSVILLFLSASILDAQIVLNTFLKHDSILVGQPNTITFQLTGAEELSAEDIKWKIPADSIASGLEIINSTVATDYNGKKGIAKSIKFRGEKTGFYPIPPIQVRINDLTYESEAKLVAVLSTLANPLQEEIRDLKEGEEIRYTFLDWLMDYGYIIVLLLLLVVLIVFLVKQFNPKPKVEKEVAPVPEVPQKSALEIAQEKIKSLRANESWKTNTTKEYYAELSYILREFIEGEHEINALELSTTEIIRELKSTGFSREILNGSTRLLNLTDLVKFAKQKPSNEESTAILDELEKNILDIHQKRQS